MQNAYQEKNRKISVYSGLTAEEYQLLHNRTSQETTSGQKVVSLKTASRSVTGNLYNLNNTGNQSGPKTNPTLTQKRKVKWRFKPKSFWPFFLWGLLLFAFCKIVLIPLTEGLYNYFTKTNEIQALQAKYHSLERQLETMNRTRDYMLTSAYVEERGHQIGMVRPNETQMLVVESETNDALQNTQIIPRRRNRSIEIGD
ncbi:MAG TPA: hypothetical protein PLZ08_10950 [Bacillota bacterium]|nr:hypothetical protein [Bacillota bacterium]HOL08839.1 hypothetical protein [Bacillota bacterium]HPO98455.1 hypothetical protein [Bacillota bacterium]